MLSVDLCDDLDLDVRVEFNMVVAIFGTRAFSAWSAQLRILPFLPHQT